MSVPCATSPLLAPRRPRRALGSCWMNWYKCSLRVDTGEDCLPWAPGFLYTMNKTRTHLKAGMTAELLTSTAGPVPDVSSLCLPGLLSVIHFQCPHPSRLLYPGTRLTTHPPPPTSSLPWKGVNSVAVNMGTSLWRTSNSDLERVRWLCPTHSLRFLGTISKGKERKIKKHQETKMKGFG